MAVKVSDVIAMMEKIAPAEMAEEWDNAGLQFGDRNWPVRNIRIALDPAPAVVAIACKKGTDLLITHHPLIFAPLKSIDTATPAGKTIAMALRHQLAIFTAHTNLDSADGGLNAELALRLELRDVGVLHPQNRPNAYKVVFFVPRPDERKVLEALLETPAGRIGDYSACSFRVHGKGTFRPGPSSRPSIGRRGKMSEVDEVRIETVVPKKDIQAVVAHIRACHPYETMAYDVYPLESAGPGQGLGRVGNLPGALKLFPFAERIKQVLQIGYVRVVGKPNTLLKRVAVCSGSGSGLIDSFFRSGADVFVSGDLRYHDARAVEAAGLSLIDIGHFASERMAIDLIAGKLRKILIDNRLDVKIYPSKIEKDPFAVI